MSTGEGTEAPGAAAAPHGTGRRRVSFAGPDEEQQQLENPRRQRHPSDLGELHPRGRSSPPEIDCHFGLLPFGGIFALDAAHFPGAPPTIEGAFDRSVAVTVTRDPVHEGAVEGTSGGRVVVEVTACRPGSIDTEFWLLSNAEGGRPESVSTKVRVSAVVMGRGKGTPQLQSHVRRTGNYVSETTDDSGSD